MEVMEGARVRIPDWVFWDIPKRLQRACTISMAEEEATRTRELLKQLTNIREELRELCPSKAPF